MELTTTQWEQIESIINADLPTKIVSGRPRQNDRNILNGILWICRTGAPWKDLPDRYPPYQTCHRRFQEWVKRGIWIKILTTFAVDLKRRGKLDLAETYMDGSFSSAKKGLWEKTSLSRGFYLGKGEEKTSRFARSGENKSSRFRA